MAATDHLNPKQFYHGTGKEFAPGDELSAEGIRKAGIGGIQAVYMTPSQTAASHYARQNAMGRREYFGQGEARPHVYEVRPTEGLESKATGFTAQRATVLREVDYTPPGKPEDWDEYAKRIPPAILGE